MSTITDDQGHKYELVQTFDHDLQQYIYVLVEANDD